MFKKTAVILGKCTRDCIRSRCMYPNSLLRWHHLAILQEKFAGNLESKQEYLKALPNLRNTAIPCDDQPTVENSSIGEICVQDEECADLINPMERRYLNDLELQQAQRNWETRWLKDEMDLEELETLTNQVTMSAGGNKSGKDSCNKEGSGKKKNSSEKGSGKEGGMKKGAGKKEDAAKKEAEAKKKCDEMAQKEKCDKMAKDEKAKKDSGKKETRRKIRARTETRRKIQAKMEKVKIQAQEKTKKVPARKMRPRKKPKQRISVKK
ncbi:sperm-specific protein Don juan-like [Drosophila serrata]|uniref:sperm-specific protein Don juan-like n=1 Tax=Drosophila serrata TaxID=7274 RepID=UPI000A1D35EA|nr:sperm-specific protein Don juan-like [Drosophila serrata]